MAATSTDLLSNIALKHPALAAMLTTEQGRAVVRSLIQRRLNNAVAARAQPTSSGNSTFSCGPALSEQAKQLLDIKQLSPSVIACARAVASMPANSAERAAAMLALKQQLHQEHPSVAAALTESACCMDGTGATSLMRTSSNVSSDSAISGSGLASVPGSPSATPTSTSGMTIFKRRHLSAQGPGFKRSTSNIGFKVRRGHAAAAAAAAHRMAAAPAGVQSRVAVKPGSPLGQALAEQLIAMTAAQMQLQQACQGPQALEPSAVLRMLQLAKAQAARRAAAATKQEQQLQSISSGCGSGPAVSSETVTCLAGGDADCSMEVDSDVESPTGFEVNNGMEEQEPKAEDGKITATLQSLVSVLAHYTQQKGAPLPAEAFKHIASAMLV